MKPVVLSEEANNNSLNETIVMEDVQIVRKISPDAFNSQAEKKNGNSKAKCCTMFASNEKTRDKKPCNSIARLLQNSETDPIAFQLQHLDLRITKVSTQWKTINNIQSKTIFCHAFISGEFYWPMW